MGRQAHYPPTCAIPLVLAVNQASKDINNYLREVGIGNLEYDKYLKGYKPTGQFQPQVTQGLADEYPAPDGAQ